MNFQGALITEQGVTFGLVVVKPHVLRDTAASERMRQFGQRVWRGVPIVLVAQDHTGRPTYQGRADIVRFLAKLALSQIPWKQWTVAA